MHFFFFFLHYNDVLRPLFISPLRSKSATSDCPDNAGFCVMSRVLLLLLSLVAVIHPWHSIGALVDTIIIDCAAISSPLVLNHTTTSSVRIANCSQRVNVTVPCGGGGAGNATTIPQQQQTTVEVVGGTTLPYFSFTACPSPPAESAALGTTTFANMSITVRQVVMQQSSGLDAAVVSAVDPLLGPVFFIRADSTSLLSVSIMDSTLLWAPPTTSLLEGQLVDFATTTGLMEVVNVTVMNSTLVVWSLNTGSNIVRLCSNTTSRHVTVQFVASTVMMSQSGFLGSSNGVVRYLSSNASDVRIAITTSQINVTDRGSIRFCIMRIEPPAPGTTVGDYARTHLTLTNRNAVVDSDASFYALTVPFAQAVALKDSTFEVRDCLITLAMIVDVMHLPTIEGAPIVFVVRLIANLLSCFVARNGYKP